VYTIQSLTDGAQRHAANTLSDIIRIVRRELETNPLQAFVLTCDTPPQYARHIDAGRCGHLLAGGRIECRFWPDPPADDMPWTNADRARHAFEAIHPAIDANGCSDSEAITYLLADLRHYCHLHRLDFADLDRRACRHYRAEIHEETAR